MIYDADNTLEQQPIEFKTPYYECNEEYSNLNPDEKRYLKSKGCEFKKYYFYSTYIYFELFKMYYL